jgi:hypothetical protein
VDAVGEQAVRGKRGRQVSKAPGAAGRRKGGRRDGGAAEQGVVGLSQLLEAVARGRQLLSLQSVAGRRA